MKERDSALWSISPEGELKGALGFKTEANPGRDPGDLAREFIGRHIGALFQVPGGRGAQMAGSGASGDIPLDLDLLRRHEDRGSSSLLYRPSIHGVPVEFSRISVQVTQEGEISGILSSLEGEIGGVSPAPSIPASQAHSVLESQWARGPVLGVQGELVYLPRRFEEQIKPLESETKARLAWKFRFRWSAPMGIWSVYVDAHSGELVGAVNELRSGDVPVRAAHWCRDPATDCDSTLAGMQWSTSSIRGALAWERDSAGGAMVSLIDSDGDGDVAHTSALSLFATLRSTYAVVIDELGQNQVFSEGGAAWSNVVISSASSSPYGLNVSETQTFACPGNAVFTIPRFSNFDVGVVAGLDGSSGSQDDLDFVEVLNGLNGPRIAAYIGSNRGAFSAVPSTGNFAALRLRSNAVNGSGNEGGYTVNVTSCLAHTANTAGDPSQILFGVTNATSASFASGNVFRHLETIQAYISSGGASGDHRFAQALKVPVSAHVNFGSNLANAFFDPDLDALYFGAGGSGNSNRNTALATDVIFHEYAHWAVERVYNLPNFGHAGAVSEAVADFIALDAYNDRYPSLAKTSFGDWAFASQARQLAQGAGKKRYPDHWSGEIHADSLILSGALWDLRDAVGTYAARDLMKSALFYFPDSFESFYMAMLAASRDRFGAAYDAAITAAFAGHGIGSWPLSISGNTVDSFESNDGFASAKTLTSGTAVKPTIYPGGDVDYFRFSAGAGPVNILLQRPFESTSLLYLGYGIQVYDVDRRLLASAMPSTIFSSPSGNSVVSEPNAGVNLNLSSPQVLYVVVSAPILSGGNNDTSNSPTLTYTLTANFEAPVAALSAARVSASMTDQRRFTLSAVNLTGFDVDQSTEAVFDHVDVLDHRRTRLADASGSNLILTPTVEAPGRLEAMIELPANFLTRYPSVGSIYFEVFVRNPLGKVSSAGLSNEVKILANATDLKAYNNIINPKRGESAVLRYQSSSSGRHRLAVYTLAGDLVKILVDRDEAPGSASVSWDGKNGEGSMVASGVYLIHLEAPGGRKTQKVIVVK